MKRINYDRTIVPTQLALDAVAAYHAGQPPEVLRERIRDAWPGGHRGLVQAAGSDLMPLFRAAQFPLPEDWPHTIPVWRGTRGISLDQARAGLCWSLNREWVCRWLDQLKRTGVKGIPLVIRREVSTADIVFYNSWDTGMGNHYREVVLDCPPAGDVDGCAAEWRQVSEAGWRRDYYAQHRINGVPEAQRLLCPVP